MRGSWGIKDDNGISDRDDTNAVLMQCDSSDRKEGLQPPKIHENRRVKMIAKYINLCLNLGMTPITIGRIFGLFTATQRCCFGFFHLKMKGFFTRSFVGSIAKRLSSTQPTCAPEVFLSTG
jgi:hypothetical protein